MAYICAKCIAEHELEQIQEDGYSIGCMGFCEACQPVFFEKRKSEWWACHTIWVVGIQRSLYDPLAIQQQLAEWAAIRFFARLLAMSA